MSTTVQQELSAEEELEKCANLLVGPMDVNTVLTHFSATEFYDRNCNNEEYKMQAATTLVPFPSAEIHFPSTTMAPFDPSIMRAKEGIEYDVEQRGGSLFIIRKQDRQKRGESRMEVQQLAIYYCVYRFNRENPAVSTLDILRAPDLRAIVNFRMLNMLYYLKEGLKEAEKFQRFAPSWGYYWDFGQPKLEPKDDAVADEAEAAPAHAEDHDEPLVGTVELEDFRRQAIGLWQLVHDKFPIQAPATKPAVGATASGTGTPRAATPQPTAAVESESRAGPPEGKAVKRAASQLADDSAKRQRR